MHKQGLQLDYLGGKIIFPTQIINEQRLDFMPSKPEERDFFFDLFKYQMLEQNRVLMRSYFNSQNSESTQSNEHCQLSSRLANKCSSQDIQPNRPISQMANRNTNLYMRIQINGRPILALIDTGADTSKISDHLALQLNILSFIDYEKRKIAHGLGSVISIGQIPPVPVKFESDMAEEDNGSDTRESSEKPKLSSVLFVPFEVLKENRVNVLLLGSDFFTYYGCHLDFARKSIDIPMGSVACKYRLEEKKPKNLNLLNGDEKPIRLDHNFLENRRISAYQSAPELDELRDKIERKEREYQMNKKLKKYKIDRTKEFNQLNGRSPNRSRQPNQRLFSTALSTLNRRGDEGDDLHDLWPLSELDELNQQASSFLNEETNSAGQAAEFKSQPPGQMIYCNGLLPENEVEEFIIKVNFV